MEEHALASSKQASTFFFTPIVSKVNLVFFIGFSSNSLEFFRIVHGLLKSEQFHFKGEKEVLRKKICDVSTLCDVEACLIIYGPNQGEPAETWPENREDVLNIIDRYRKKCIATKGKGIRQIVLNEFYKGRIKKLRRELIELQEINKKTKYSTWDDRINNLSVDQLKTLSSSLGFRIEFSSRLCLVA
ncbi:agamous-like MADS-box protein AGL103 [Macadamia integrifolia]|uniref:agamous-like MADS-box protein AGL103 n=1 Tax=Macadamia integrifolia TaxID=60698 RepID=UPI001C4EE54D|nr:agamous-like MADS-box protein AGL103 [Macadamia integrifolia]